MGISVYSCVQIMPAWSHSLMMPAVRQDAVSG
nr:MAG TPA: hypothetical protein [Caudoviricetes sp.]